MVFSCFGIIFVINRIFLDRLSFDILIIRAFSGNSNILGFLIHEVFLVKPIELIDINQVIGIGPCRIILNHLLVGFIQSIDQLLFFCWVSWRFWAIWRAGLESLFEFVEFEYFLDWDVLFGLRSRFIVWRQKWNFGGLVFRKVF